MEGYDALAPYIKEENMNTTLKDDLKKLETMPARVTAWQAQMTELERDLREMRSELTIMRMSVDSSIRKIERIVHDHPISAQWGTK